MRALQDRAQALQTHHDRLLHELESLQFRELSEKDDRLAASLATHSELQSRENTLQRTADSLAKDVAGLSAAHLATEQTVQQLQTDLSALQQRKSDNAANHSQRAGELQSRLDMLKQQDLDASAKLVELAEEAKAGTEESESLKDRNFQLSRTIATVNSELTQVKQAFDKMRRTVQTETESQEADVDRKIEQLRLHEEELARECNFLQDREEMLNEELMDARAQLERLKRRPEWEYEARDLTASLRIPEHPLGITAVSCRPRTKAEEITTISELERDISVLSRKCRRTCTPTAAEDNAPEIASLTSLIDEKTKHLTKLKRSRQAAIRDQVISTL